MSTLLENALLALVAIAESILEGDNSPVPYPGPETEKDNCNHTLCAECGGECCKKVGCTFSPQDFIRLSPEHKLTPEGILNEVKKGYITLELYDGDQHYVEGLSQSMPNKPIDEIEELARHNLELLGKFSK